MTRPLIALVGVAAFVVASGFSRTSQAPRAAQIHVAPDLPTDAIAFPDVPAPSLQPMPNDGYAQVTMAPWVQSNGWRFMRGQQRASYKTIPRGVAPLAAAEAFAFNVDAILNPDPADAQELGNMLRFLKAHAQPPLPPLANIGVIDDGSPAMGEALNMLIRRNLLYRIVKQPDRTLDLTVQIGSRDFPAQSLANPSDFAARVREKLTDDKRLVRVFGANTIVARLSGDGKKARLILVSYARNRAHQDIRVSLLGKYTPASFALYGAPAGATLVDVVQAGKVTEFGISTFNTIAIVDLDVVK
jgi:hypothetical protein